MTGRAALLALAVALAAALPPGPAPAADPDSQLARQVAKELPSYGVDVDVATLSTHQLARIYGVMHRPLSHSEKRAQIRSILGGRFSLRGLLFD